MAATLTIIATGKEFNVTQMSYIIENKILLGVEFSLAEKQQVIRLSPQTAYIIEGKVPSTHIGVMFADQECI